MAAPNCHECEYFKISWDNRFPRSCSKFGFKGRQLPSVEVLAATGQQCCFFQAKARESFVSLTVLPEHSTLSIVG